MLGDKAFDLSDHQVVDNFFCIFFSFEISVRFLAYQKSRDAFKDQS